MSEEEECYTLPNIIFLNGPPGCGKDTMANYLSEKGFIHLAFSDILIDMTIKFFGCTREEFFLIYNCVEKTEKGIIRSKDIPNKIFTLGNEVLSARQALIHVSENVIKTFFGKDIFGKLLRDKINVINTVSKKSNNFIISGAGFIDEITPCLFSDYYKAIIKMYRDGCSFSNDSRSYIPKIPYVDEYEIKNNDTIETLYKNIDELLSKFNYNC